MSKVTFVPQPVKAAAKDTPVILYYTCADGRLPYYTRVRVDPALWPAGIPKAARIQLNRITDTIERLASDYKIKEAPLTKARLKAAIDALLGKSRRSAGPDMFSQMKQVVSRMRSGEILTKKNKRYSPGTLKTLDFTITVLYAFDRNLSIDSTSMDTYRRFIAWCQKQDYSLNYIGAQVKNWKILGQKIGGNPVFNNPEFKKIQEDTFDIYLVETEIARMIKLQLPERESVVRDWFVIGCYTGLRVSDLLSLQKKNLSKSYITIANEKTDEKVVIPIHKQVRKIISKYKGFPPAVTDVEINRIIKKIAKQAKIDDNVLYTITKGGKRQDHYLKKWEMVSSHTMRRSFITNMRKRKDGSDNVTMLISGIKSAATLKKYDKLTADEAAKIAAGMDFFK